MLAAEFNTPKIHMKSKTKVNFLMEKSSNFHTKPQNVIPKPGSLQ